MLACRCSENKWFYKRLDTALVSRLVRFIIFMIQLCINRRLYIYFRLTIHVAAQFRFSTSLSDANDESWMKV